MTLEPGELKRMATDEEMVSTGERILDNLFEHFMECEQSIQIMQKRFDCPETKMLSTKFYELTSYLKLIELSPEQVTQGEIK